MTLTELYTAALQEIGKVASGEVAEADDRDVVEQKYLSLYAMLEAKNLVDWGVSEEVPTYAEQPITYMLAFLCCQAFGVSGQKRQEMGVLGALDAPQPSIAERQLRKLAAKKYYYQPARTEYF